MIYQRLLRLSQILDFFPRSRPSRTISTEREASEEKVQKMAKPVGFDPSEDEFTSFQGGQTQRSLEVVLAHDSFTQSGGAERVLGVLHELYPQAPIYTLMALPDIAPRDISKIHTSFIQYLYKLWPRFQHLLPFIPLALAMQKVEACDVLLSSSSSFIKGIRKPKGAVHINYCHTPTRFLWQDSDYVRQEVPKLLLPFAQAFLWWFKHWDLRAARRVDYFLANSTEVQKRIQDTYGRESVICYPPINTEFWKPTRPKGNYFLLAGRLIAHKNSEVVIQAANELGVSLHVVGTGRHEAALKAVASSNITFLGKLNDADLRDEYSSALALVYPQFEDFGMMPIEAASCGTPTLALAAGGSLETVIPGRTGELFAAATVEQVKKAMHAFDPQKYNTSVLIEYASKFSIDRFRKEITDFVNSHTDAHSN
jgi:glycosyltransferase involved in cell wall biosynthesis